MSLHISIKHYNAHRNAISSQITSLKPTIYWTSTVIFNCTFIIISSRIVDQAHETSRGALSMVRLLQVFQTCGAEPGFLLQDRFVATICRRGVKATFRACSLSATGRSKHSGLWVWLPVFLRLGLDHIIRNNTRPCLFINVLVICWCVPKSPAEKSP